MEREVRDVVSALAGCVAMRCAAEENRRDIADMEMLQRAVWEAEFSSCAHPVAILPPAGVSRHRARERNKSTAVKTNGGSINDRGDRDLIFDAKSTGDGKQTSSSSGSNHTVADFDSHANQQQQCQQHRLLNSDQGLQEQTMSRAHSLGSATFLFNSSCLEHKKKGEPDVRRNPNGSDILGGGGRGGGDSQRSSAVGGRVSGHVGRGYSKNNGGISKSSRWGSAKAILKSSLSPYKLVPDTQQQLDDEYETGEMTSSSTCGISLLTPDTPRSCPGVACSRLATDISRKATGPIVREPLRRSTWLGPEISPLQNNPNGRFTNPNCIGFEAAAWPGPSKNRRWWDARKRGKYWREATNGSTTTTGKEIEYEHGVRPPARRGVLERNKAAGIALSGTGIDPQGHQTMGAQEWLGGGGGDSACTLSAYQGQAREYSGLGSTVERCGSTVERCCEDDGTSPSDSPEKTMRGPSTFIWQNEICLAPVCLRPSALCGVLSERGEASSKRRQCDGARENIWGEMPQSYATQKESEGSRSPCLNHREGLPSEGSHAAQNETCDGAAAPAAPLQKTGGIVATGWSAEEYGQSGDEGEEVGARVHEDVGYEPSTSEEDNGSCGNPGATSPRSEGGDIGGDSSKNADEGEFADHACATTQAPTAKGVSRPPRPKSHRGSSDPRPRGGVSRETLGKVNVDGGTCESARGELGPVLSSEVEVPFQFGTSDLVSGLLGARDPLHVRRRRWQQKSQHFQCYKYPQQDQQKQQRQQQQRLLSSQRRTSSDDQEGRFERTDLQDKHIILLTRRLKQLVQLESLTIQWERLPRRERDKLDRQQRLTSSRFRVTEQARRDSSIPLSVLSSPGSTCRSTVVPFGGGGCVGGDGGGGGGGGGVSSNSSNSNSSHSTPTNNNGRVGGDPGAFLSSGSGISPSSIDLDRPSAGGGGGVDAGVVGCANGRPVGVSRDAVQAIVLAKGTTRHPRTGSTSGVAPMGEGRRWREGGGVKERVDGSGGDSVTCRTRDAGIAAGLARRGRVGDLSLSIVGMGSPVSSGGLAGASEMSSLMVPQSKGEGPCLRV